MKKTIYSLFLGLCISMMLPSCKKFLEVEPTNRVVVSSFADVYRLMGGHLRSYIDDQEQLSGTSRFFANEDEYLLAHFYADDYDSERYLSSPLARNNRGIFAKSLEWNYTDGVESIWSHYYRNIGFFNMILAELEKNPSTDKEEQQRVDAEARILRAWAFFKLMQYYVPYKHADLGLPLNTDPNQIGDYTPVRRSQKENYDFIIGELKTVLGYTAKPRASYNIFYDKRIVEALLAQIYHFKAGSAAGVEQDYHEAIQYANSVLKSGINPDVTIRVPQSSNNETYFGMHKDLGYTVLSFVQNNSGPFVQYVPGNVYYQAYQYPSKALIDLFDDTDKRKVQFFDTNEGFVKKYDTEFLYAYDQYDFFRGSEMLLIIAESWARLSNEAEASKALQRFVQPRYTQYTQPKGLSILDAILVERRKEFCFDYTMRWLDLVRLQTPFQRTYTNEQKVQNTYKLEKEDYRFCLPIPQKAELNHAKIQQNPGW